MEVRVYDSQGPLLDSLKFESYMYSLACEYLPCCESLSPCVLLIGRSQNFPCGLQGEMAIFTGQVRRISQNLILFSSPLAMWEGVVRLGVGGRNLGEVTGDIPIDEILILSLFCIIYC